MTPAEAIKVLEKMREDAYRDQVDCNLCSRDAANYLAGKRDVEEALALAIRTLRASGGPR